MLNMHVGRRRLSTPAHLGAIGALLAVALPVALSSQNAFATISGSITDPSDGVLPGVSVVAVDTERRVRHEVRTNRAGRFELVGLPEGSYSLEADLPGFEMFRERLTLSGLDVSRDIMLEVGMLQETVSVSSSASIDGPGAPSPRAAPRPATCGAAAPGPGGALRVGGQIRQPRKLYHVAPIYPAGAPAGSVRMDAVIDTNGFVKETRVTNDAPAALADAAVAAVRQWEFDPTLLNCQAIDVRMSVFVDFR
jgi:hypothetical protein